LARFDQIPLQEWDDVLAGNLRSTVLLCRHAIPLLEASGDGTIVNVASAMGTRSVPNHGPYAAAKAAVLNFTRTVAIEAAPRVRANAVAPSAVDTDFHRGGTGRDEIADAANDPSIFAANVPMGRIARAEDIVGPVLFLAGPNSQFVTGQTLLVNGGTW
jgi:3-oxoacyl-[acyl-carrier protein] reductase